MRPPKRRLKITPYLAVKNKYYLDQLKFVLRLLLMSSASFGEPVDFEKTSRIVNSIKLGDTEITLANASELLCEGAGTGDVSYFDAATLNDSFILEGGRLLLNGRVVIGFKAGDSYIFKSGILSNKESRPLPVSENFLYADQGKVATIKDSGREIKVIGVGIGGGVTEKFADGFLVWVSSYVCARIWDGEFYLWGVNYGSVKALVEVNLKNKTLTIDKGKPVPIKMHL